MLRKEFSKKQFQQFIFIFKSQTNRKIAIILKNSSLVSLTANLI
jgi:hypothetical protein